MHLPSVHHTDSNVGISQKASPQDVHYRPITSKSRRQLRPITAVYTEPRQPTAAQAHQPRPPSGERKRPKTGKRKSKRGKGAKPSKATPQQPPKPATPPQEYYIETTHSIGAMWPEILSKSARDRMIKLDPDFLEKEAFRPRISLTKDIIKAQKMENQGSAPHLNSGLLNREKLSPPGGKILNLPFIQHQQEEALLLPRPPKQPRGPKFPGISSHRPRKSKKVGSYER